MIKQLSLLWNDAEESGKGNIHEGSNIKCIGTTPQWVCWASINARLHFSISSSAWGTHPPPYGWVGGFVAGWMDRRMDALSTVEWMGPWVSENICEWMHRCMANAVTCMNGQTVWHNHLRNMRKGEQMNEWMNKQQVHEFTWTLKSFKHDQQMSRSRTF